MFVGLPYCLPRVSQLHSNPIQRKAEAMATEKNPGMFWAPGSPRKSKPRRISISRYDSLWWLAGSRFHVLKISLFSRFSRFHVFRAGRHPVRIWMASQPDLDFTFFVRRPRDFHVFTFFMFFFELPPPSESGWPWPAADSHGGWSAR